MKPSHFSGRLFIKPSARVPPCDNGILRTLATMCTTTLLFCATDKLSGLLSPIVRVLFCSEVSKEGSWILVLTLRR